MIIRLGILLSTLWAQPLLTNIHPDALAPRDELPIAHNSSNRADCDQTIKEAMRLGMVQVCKNNPSAVVCRHFIQFVRECEAQFGSQRLK